MWSMASLHFSSCTGSSCWLKDFIPPVQWRNYMESSKPPSVAAALVAWYYLLRSLLFIRVYSFYISMINNERSGRFLVCVFSCTFLLLMLISVSILLLGFQFVFLTYVLGVAWLGVFGFSSIPVFLFFNIWSTCSSMNLNTPSNSSVCVDMRQYGT